MLIGKNVEAAIAVSADSNYCNYEKIATVLIPSFKRGALKIWQINRSGVSSAWRLKSKYPTVLGIVECRKRIARAMHARFGPRYAKDRIVRGRF